MCLWDDNDSHGFTPTIPAFYQWIMLQQQVPSTHKSVINHIDITDHPQWPKIQVSDIQRQVEIRMRGKAIFSPSIFLQGIS
jgi:hypothetical protein